MEIFEKFEQEASQGLEMGLAVSSNIGVERGATPDDLKALWTNLKEGDIVVVNCDPSSFEPFWIAVISEVSDNFYLHFTKSSAEFGSFPSSFKVDWLVYHSENNGILPATINLLFYLFLFIFMP